MRTITQTQKLSILEITMSVILLFLVVFDLCEIWELTSSLVINKDQFDVFEKVGNNKVKDSKDEDEIVEEGIQKGQIDDKAKEQYISDKDWTNKEFLKNREKELADTPIDEVAMVKKLESNPTIQLFCTNDLRKEHKFSKNTVILVSNYAFLLRIIAIHLIIVSLPFMPVYQLIAMILLEVSYFGMSSG
jgi:hypothetical protein